MGAPRTSTKWAMVEVQEYIKDRHVYTNDVRWCNLGITTETGTTSIQKRIVSNRNRTGYERCQRGLTKEQHIYDTEAELLLKGHKAMIIVVIEVDKSIWESMGTLVCLAPTARRRRTHKQTFDPPTAWRHRTKARSRAKHCTSHNKSATDENVKQCGS